MNNNGGLSSAEVERREAQRLYNQEYYKRNKKAILERNRKWRKNNPEKVKLVNERYWAERLKKNQEV